MSYTVTNSEDRFSRDEAQMGPGQSVDPNQMLQNTESDQGPQCLHIGISGKNKTEMRKVHQTPLK